MKKEILFLLICFLFSLLSFGQYNMTLGMDGKLKKTDDVLSNVITIISAGSQVRIISGPISGVYYVDYNGIKGYINELYLSKPSNSSNYGSSSNNSTDNTFTNCGNIKYIPPTVKPSFQTFLSGVKYAVILNKPKINGHWPAFNALYEDLQGMGFQSVEYFNENYEKPKHICEEVFVTIAFNYDIGVAFYNISMTWSSPCNKYSWTFTTNKQARDDGNSKYNFGLALRDMYGYKKNDFNPSYRLELPRRQTCWTEAKFKSDVQTNGCDILEGIYESAEGSIVGSPKYRLAVRKINGTYYLIYLSGAQNTGNWTEGEIKATLETTATTLLFKSKWLMADKSENNDFYFSFENGLMNLLKPKGEKDLYVKLFPSSSDKQTAPSEIAGSGSGYAISSNGYIATNHHVTNGATSIKVRGIKGDFSKTYSAKIIIEDKNNDLSIIKIDDPSFTSLGAIPYIIANRSSDVGSSIFVLGYPLRATMGDEVKLTNGIISSKSGFQGDVTSYQITAPVQPGNSGGPLFDDKGNIIGIVNAKNIDAENAAYAIKSSYLMNLIDLMPTPPKLQTISTVVGKPLTEQVKILKNFTYIIEVN